MYLMDYVKRTKNIQANTSLIPTLVTHLNIQRKKLEQAKMILYLL